VKNKKQTVDNRINRHSAQVCFTEDEFRALIPEKIMMFIIHLKFKRVAEIERLVIRIE
jgi:hypothetical protein